jgi:CDP-diacylglycerol--glycerol-3-phosphate 3-phosphatidyltransferase
VKITANQVTITRILLLPIPAWMLLSGDKTLLWVGLAIGTVLGATDAVDGYMARRDGPTVLGGLLDPVADKVFVATFLIPLVGLGHCPWWAAGLIFVRELLITALRSSVAARDEKLQTSKLGKIKTIAQMGGLGLYVFVRELSKPEIFYVHAAGIGGLFVFLAIMAARKKKPPYWVGAAIVLWTMLTALTWYFDETTAVLFWLFIIMLVLTWISGTDYLVNSAKLLLRTGIRLFDVVRIFWSIAHGLAPVALVATEPVTAIPALLALACALSVGGIDNIASARTQEPIRAFLLLGSIIATAVALLGPVMALAGQPLPKPYAIGAAVALLAINLVSLIRAFIQHRDALFEETPA